MYFDKEDYRYPLPLLAYARRGDIRGVERVLAQGVEVDFAWPDDDFRGTALWAACESLDAGLEMLEFLVERGASIEAVLPGGRRSPVSAAARTNQTGKLRWLLDKGASINAVTESGYTALLGAAIRAACEDSADRLDSVRLLLERGADPTGVSSYGESPLSVASRRADWESVSLFLKWGCDPRELGWDDLMFAIAFGSVQDVERHLRLSENPSYTDACGRSPWLLAIAGGEVEKAQLFLDSGSSVAALGKNRQSVLQFALTRDHPEMVKWLLAHHADPNTVDADFERPLAQAASYDRIRSTKVLLTHCAPGTFSKLDLNRAMAAARSPEVARTLATAGADLEVFGLFDLIQSHKGSSVELMATVGRTLDIGWDLQKACGVLPLNAASRANSLETMKLLLDRGADPNATDVDDYSALSECVTPEACDLLIERGADPRLVGARNMLKRD